MSATDLMETTEDTFLGGRVTIRQPKTGFRAGLDSVLLAASVKARAGDHLLDAGCGAGVASLCLAARQSGLHITGVDSNPDAIRLCTDNIAANDLSDVITARAGDVFALPRDIAQDAFDHVITNPPFHDGTREWRSPDAGKAAAHGFDGAYDEAIGDWLGACLKALKSKGRIWIINRSEALGAMLSALEGPAGDIEVYPLWPKQGAAAKRVLITARKGARGGNVLHPGIVLHEADGTFTPRVEAALRAGEPLFIDQG